MEKWFEVIKRSFIYLIFVMGLDVRLGVEAVWKKGKKGRKLKVKGTFSPFSFLSIMQTIKLLFS